jgi:glucan phosphoethanolaminetransferase (alkaline phosphatase superfamily)
MILSNILFITYMAIALLILNQNFYTSIVLAVLFILISFFYVSIVRWGIFKYDILLSMQYSNASEFFNLLSNFTLKEYFISCCIALLGSSLPLFSGSINYQQSLYGLVLIGSLVYSSQTPFLQEQWQELKKYQNIQILIKKDNFTNNPFLKDLNKDNKQELSKQSKIYVLILGESVNRNYLNIYGYPIENTPFLKKLSNLTIVEGYNSAWWTTIKSLSYSLTATRDYQKDFQYSANINNLVQAYGFKTIFASNQGSFEGSDTPITLMNINADKRHSLKKQWAEANISDFVLTDILKEELNKATNDNYLFTLHMIGSHFNTCNMVKDVNYPHLEPMDAKYKNLACYVKSLNKLDDFLKKVYQILQSTDRDFSILYISDHGYQPRKDDFYFTSYPFERNTEVPLLIIEKQQTQQEYIKNTKHGLRFIDGLANWLGIKHPLIIHYSFIDGRNDNHKYDTFSLLKKEQNPVKANQFFNEIVTYETYKDK